MVNMILAAAAKVVLNWNLTAIPALGIMGSAWATAADMGVAAVINLCLIYRFSGYHIEIGQLLTAIAAAIFMAIAVKGFYDGTMLLWGIGAISTFGAVFFGIVIYLAALVAVGGMHEADMASIPMIGKFGIRLMRRIGVFKDEPEAHSDEKDGISK